MGNLYKKAQERVEEFNRTFQPGTPVRFWTGARLGEGRIGKTRTEAQALSGHTPVVWLEGIPGCVSLSHIESLEM